MFSLFLYSCGFGSVALMFFGFFLSCVYSIRFTLLLLRHCGGILEGYSSVFYITCGVTLFGTFINYFGGVLISEVSGLSSGFSAFLLVLQASGCFFGWVVYVYGYRILGFWESLLWGSDGVVRLVYSVFLSLSEVSLLGSYRWEVYTSSLFVSPSYLGGRFSLFTMNFLVCGLLFVVITYFGALY